MSMFVLTLYDNNNDIVKQYLADNYNTLFEYYTKNSSMFFEYMTQYNFTMEVCKLENLKFIKSK